MSSASAWLREHMNPRWGGTEFPHEDLSNAPLDDAHIAKPTELAFTDARSRRAGQSRNMSTQSVQQTAPVDSLVYAHFLYNHAAGRLDPISLRCWIIQRLMLDDGLEHGCAEDVFEHVASTSEADGT